MGPPRPSNGGSQWDGLCCKTIRLLILCVDVGVAVVVVGGRSGLSLVLDGKDIFVASEGQIFRQDTPK